MKLSAYCGMSWVAVARTLYLLTDEGRPLAAVKAASTWPEISALSDELLAPVARTWTCDEVRPPF